MSETLTSSPGQIDASRLAMGGQTDSQVGSKFTQVAKSRKFHFGWPNETQVEGKSKTCVDLRRLVSPFGQDLVKD